MDTCAICWLFSSPASGSFYAYRVKQLSCGVLISAEPSLRRKICANRQAKLSESFKKFWSGQSAQ
eukprot:1853441-Rhodomonas_salina.1